MTRPVNGTPTTSTLFANPGFRQQSPGAVIRTRVASPDQGIDFEVVLNDPGHVIKRVIVETVRTDATGNEQEAVFTITDILPPPCRREGCGDTIPNAG